MEKRYSIGEISKLAGVHENTVRRYVGLFEKYLDGRRERRAVRYTYDAVNVISRVSQLYDTGYTTREVDSVLSKEFPTHPTIVECEQETALDVTPPAPHLPHALQLITAEFENLKSQIAATRTQVETLTDEIKAKDAKITALEETLHHNYHDNTTAINELHTAIKRRDAKLIETMRNMMEEKKPWWKRLF